MQLLTRLYANLPVALKLATGFAVLITLTIATGLVGVQALNQYGESATVVARTSAIESALLSARTEEKNFLLRNDPAFVQTAREHLDTASAIARELTEQLTGNRADLLDNILEGSARYGELLTQVSEVMAEKDKVQEQLVLDGRILEAQINTEDRLYLATATFKQMRREEQDFLLTGNRDALTQFNDRLGRAQASIRSSALDQDEKDEISSLFDAYASAFQATAAHIQRTNVLEGEMVKTARASLEASDALQDHQVRQMAVDRRQAMLTIAVSTTVVIALGVVLAWLLTRTITRPIREAVAIAQNVADGDLRTRVHNDRTDELGKLLSALGTMVTNLRDLVHRIDTNATDVAASSGQLSAVTEQNRQGAADQRDQTDQVATAMNQMVATVNDVARSAESAASAAADASQKAGDGEHAVNDTLTLVGDLSNQVQQAMGRLRTLQSDTHNINTVLDVIKSVAEQTNLLALNAAIEAARAGQHGRGFAVVADEVRSLAQRTQTSATEIEELITNLVTSAEETVAVMETSTGLASRTLESANTTGETIRQMTQAVDNITRLNQQIATAAEEQTSVAEDINLNITLIRDFSDQTATSTEQVSSASADLARLGEGLRNQVARFQV